MTSSNWNSISITVNCKCKLLKKTDGNCSICRKPTLTLSTPLSDLVKNKPTSSKVSTETNIVKQEPSWNVSVELRSSSIREEDHVMTVPEVPFHTSTNVKEEWNNVSQGYTADDDNEWIEPKADISHETCVRDEYPHPCSDLPHTNADQSEEIYVSSSPSSSVIILSPQSISGKSNSTESDSSVYDFTEGSTVVSNFNSNNVNRKYENLYTTAINEEEDTEFTCNTCSKSFLSEKGIKLHVIRCKYSSDWEAPKKRNSKCKPKKLIQSVIMKRKDSSVDDARFKCKFCGKPYKLKKLKDKHSRQHVESGGYIKCFWCTPPLYFQKSEDAVRHQKDHK